MVWGFLATFFFFAGIGAVAGIIYGTYKGFPLVIDGVKGFLRACKEGWNSVDWDGNPKDHNS